MTSYDFDSPIDRRHSDSYKWRKYQGRDVLPLWVADMDFKSPPEIIQALQERVAHGVFGYPEATPEFFEAIQYALERDYGWAVAQDWIIPLPGLVCGLNVAARATVSSGGSLLTTTPIYPPFLQAAGHAGRETLRVPLREENGEWSWDCAAMESQLRPHTQALFLCHPHNPVGRVWRDDELRQLEAFAEANKLTVVSDEIHAELVLDRHCTHRPYALLSENAQRHSITLMAPSKTYNIPGLGASFAIIPNMILRQRFQRAMAGIVPHLNIMAYVATTAAYQEGAAWRAALLDYLRGNRDYLLQELQGYKGLSLARPEATYLAWIDCRGAGLTEPTAFFERAGLGLSDGRDFGLEGFVRLNFGCPRATLVEAVARIKKALA